MTHWNKASKSSLHTKIWQLYHCTTWLLANIQSPVYPLKFYRLVSEGVNNNPPTPQIKYMYHMLLQLTVRFLISYTTYNILLSLKIYTEKSICFWRHVLSVNAWTLPFFFPKYLTEQIRRQADTVSLPCWICFQGSTLDSRTLPQPDTLAQWYRCPEWTSHSSDRICLPTKQWQNMSWVMYFYPCI